MSVLKKPITLPVAEYAPDMPALQNQATINVSGVLPRTSTSYGPLASPQVYSAALGARCQGAAAFLDASDNVATFSGTATDLYEITSTSTTPANVSQVAASYACPSDGQWNFQQFGTRIIATDYADAMQNFVLGTSSKFADLANGGITALTLVGGSGYTNGTYALTVSNGGSGSGFAGTVTVSGGALASSAITTQGKGYPQTATIAVPAGAGAGTGGTITPTIATIAPSAKYLAVIKSFVVAAHTNDATNGAQPWRMWWCANNDPTNWPTPGTATAAEFQSSFLDVLGGGGQIQGIVGNLGGADGALFQEHAVWRIVYEGPPTTFGIYPAEGVRGTPAPNSLVQLGNQVYYLGEDGFYRFDGVSSSPIGANRVDRTFFANLNQTYYQNVIGTVDPINKVIVWAYPSNNSGSGLPDSLLIYHWQLDRWSPVTGLSLEWIARLLTFGYTLDQTFSVLGFTLDTLPFPLDSKAWTGGNLLLGAFDTAHKLNYFDGAPMAATVDTVEIQPAPPRLATILSARPIVDGGMPSVAIGTRNRSADAISFGMAVAMDTYGKCPVVASGRYHRGRITMAAGDTGWTHIEGLQYEEVSQDGEV